MLCPYCRTENAPGAIRCAHCTSWIRDPPPPREWVRAREGRWLGGVARGLATRFSVPCAAVRLVFLLSILFGGWGILAYVALWIAMPLEPLALPPATIEARPAGAEPPA
jgi:phage shock protein PspC (stress-responsive transcriptional regulator)